MPKNQVNDPITDQEMAFARLVISGTMNDRQAAEAAGLNPETAAYIKAKPRVRAYMLKHRAAVQEHLAQQEAEGLHRLTISREQVLARLWEIANLSPEATRNSITGQVKALSMIVAIEGLIPDRKEKPADPPPPKADIYHPPWFYEAQAQAAGHRSTSDLTPQQEESDIPDPPPAPDTAAGDSNEFNESVSAAVIDPADSSSIEKEPYVRRYGPF
jgi:hypothetical protein